MMRLNQTNARLQFDETRACISYRLLHRTCVSVINEHEFDQSERRWKHWLV